MSEGPGDLAPEARQALADWLLALSDNKQLLGLRYAEWCTGAPELEGDIAASAMAQYELGHARLLHGVLSTLEEDPRDESRDSDPASWRCLPVLDAPFEDWTELVVANALLDSLLTVNLEAACGGDYRPLRQRLRKAVQEEHYHFVHGRAWFRRLADGPEEAAARLEDAVAGAWPSCAGWFGPDEEGGLDRLADAGVLDAGSAGLLQRYLDRVGPLFEDVPFEPPARRTDDGWVVDATPDWSGWSEERRRHGAAALSEDCFRMITGADAEAIRHV